MRFHSPVALIHIAPALAVTAAVMAVLVPPEIHPIGGALFGVFAAAAALVISFKGLPGLRSSWGALLILLPLGAAAVLGASCRARAVDEAALFTALVAIGLAGAGAAREGRGTRVIAALIATLAVAASLQAIAQHHWAYPGQAALLRATDPTGSDNLIVRLESGRPSGPFLLPSALAGFIAMALPATLQSWFHPAGPWVRVFWSVALLAQAYALLLTRSIGGVAAAAAALVLMLSHATLRRRKAAMLAIVVLAIGAAGWFVHARRGEFENVPGGDPLRLRAGNWLAAARMIGERPLLGVGPGSFGTAYTRQLRAGMNETQYAHNSYLQLVACWGLWVAAPLGALLLLMARRWWVSPVDDGMRRALLAGGGAFLLHNLVDFTAFLPSVAASAALLLGVAAAPRPGTASERGVSGWGLRLLVALSAVFLLARTVPAVQADHFMDEARRRAVAGDPEGAAESARRAAGARPSSPDPWAFLAQQVLADPSPTGEMLSAGEAAAERAVALDPESAILHHTRALYHRAAGEMALAYRELYRAHELYPLKPQYNLRPDAGPEPASRRETGN